MPDMRHDERAAAGADALAAGDWPRARSLLAAVERPDAAVLDGLGRALWWLGEPLAALRARERAYGAYRDEGDPVAAARLAVWLAREYRDGRGNTAAASGWHRRAARLVAGLPDGAAHGWLALLEAERATRPDRAAERAQTALAVAARWEDLDGELKARAQLGLAETRRGRVDAGMAALDEAMAAATSERLADWEAFGYVCCALVAACELAGDAGRMGQWSEVVTAFLDEHPHVPLLAFCASCCGELFLAGGALGPAERELERALAALHRAGQTARCVHPAARLAQLRVLQGRLEEAEGVLTGYEGLPEAVAPAVALHLARGTPAAASAVLRRRLEQIGPSSLLAAPLLVLQVDAALAEGDAPAAGQAAKQLAEVARSSGLPRWEAEADRAQGRVAAATGGGGALDLLERALHQFSVLALPLDEARVRADIAAMTADENPDLAAVEARAAVAIFERVGASREADAASALLRRIVPAGRAGPKGHGRLTRREAEVLRLVAHGLTNAEIAERLFISTKTAGNHVSSILSKLGVRNRAEAAVHAQRSGSA